MNMKNGIRAFWVALLPLLAACGGGDGVGSGGTGILRSVVAVGAIPSMDGVDGSGHMTVNGVRFDISQAQIETDAISSAKSLPAQPALKPGMTVQVTGTVDPGLSTGTATHVLSVPELRGTVDEVLAPQGVFSVMGVRVSVDQATVFDGLGSLPALQSGQSVQVYAMPDSGAGGSTLRATRVEAIAAGPGAVPPVLWGQVQALDTAARRFSLGDLQVSYAQAAFVEGLDAAALANGTALYVSADQAPAGQMLDARQLRPAHMLSPQANAPATVAGLVAQFDSLQSFVLQGTPVDASQAQFYGGQKSDMGPGARVELAGRMVAGVLMAERVQILQPAVVNDVPPNSTPGNPGSPTAPQPGNPGNPSPGSPANPNAGGNGSSNAGGNGNSNARGNGNGNSNAGGNGNGNGSSNAGGNGSSNAGGNGNGNGNSNAGGNGNGNGKAK
jgi:hypothetical protein